MVDVVLEEALFPGMELHEVPDGRDDVLFGEDRRRRIDAQEQLLVDLVAPDLREVVALPVEEQPLEQVARGIHRRRLARTELPVDVHQRFLGGHVLVLLERGRDGLGAVEHVEDVAVVVAESLEQDRDVLAPLAVHANADEIALVDLELKPSPT